MFDYLGNALAIFEGRRAQKLSDARIMEQNRKSAEISRLRLKLHATAINAHNNIDNMPETHACLSDEIREIEEFMRPGDLVADAILAIEPQSVQDRDAHMAAMAWRRGEYRSAYL